MAAKNDKLSRDGRLLLTRMEHQHASASPQRWDELRAELFSAMRALPKALSASAAPSQVAILEQEFNAVRGRALAKRRVALVREALRCGRATPSGSAGAFDVFDVPWGDGQSLSLLAPGAGLIDPGAAVARAAALSGRCTKCSAVAQVSNDEVVIVHKRRCPGAHFAPA